MAAPPPPAPPLAPALLAALAVQVAPLALIPGIQAQVALIPGMQAQVALIPGIQAQVALIPGIQAQVALIPGMQGHINAMQGQMNAMQGQMNALQGQMAAVLAQLLVINPPGLCAVVSANLRAIEAARARNHHDHRGVPLAPVPRMDGTPPPSWPPGGFSRDDLIVGLVAPIDALLLDYALPAHAAGGTVPERRAALARALGTHGL